MTIHYQEFTSPLGTMLITANSQALTGCYFVDQKHFPKSHREWVQVADDPLLTEVQRMLAAYFHSGEFDCHIKLAPQGTDFQRQVWDALLTIPAGQTRSYGQIAAMLGKPTATRAVAGAIGRNPIGIVIPCHRVIGSNGSLTGYAGGIERKQALLKLEGVLQAI